MSSDRIAVEGRVPEPAASDLPVADPAITADLPAASRPQRSVPGWPAAEGVVENPAAAAAAARCRSRLVRLVWAEPCRAALVLTLFLLVFFWTPLTRGGYYAGADLLQYFPLLRVAPPDYVPKNGLLGDTVVVMFPSLSWSKTLLWQGELPLWNPYNGWGVPHLGNYQSAVFSPFSLPFYLLPFRAALVVAAFAKLFLFGFFTYLWLRLVGLSFPAALLGGVAFMFGGYHVLWLNWPLVGPGIALPAGLYFAELALRRPIGSLLAGRTAAGPDALPAPARFGGRWLGPTAARRGLALLGFTLALTVGLLTGHPETFFYSASLLGSYILFRLAQMREGWSATVRRLAEFGATAVLALALAAVQLLPFFEYLRSSTALVQRDERHVLMVLFLQFLPLQAFPNLLGSPALPYYDPIYELIGANYIEANGNYIGMIVLFLAGLAVVAWPLHRAPLVAFFAVASVLWFLMVYNVWGFGALVNTLPVLKLGVPLRSHVIWLLSLSCLAAFALDLVCAGGGRAAVGLGGPFGSARPTGLGRELPAGTAPLLLGAAAVLAAALLAASLLGAYDLVHWASLQKAAAMSLPPSVRTAAEAGLVLIKPELALLLLSFVAAVAAVVAALCLLPRVPVRWVRGALGVALVPLVFLQTGGLLRDFNPTIEPRYFYSVTPALTEITRLTGNEQTLRVDGAGIPVNSNLWYRLRALGNYDAIGVRWFDELHTALIANATKPRSLRALEVMGVRYVATGQRRPFAWLAAAASPAPGPESRPTAALGPGGSVSQTFRATTANLAAVAFPIVTFGRTNACTLEIALDEVGLAPSAGAAAPSDPAAGTSGGETPVARTALPCASLRDDVWPVLAFEPLPGSENRLYRLTVSSPDAAPGTGVGLLYHPGTVEGEPLRLGGQAVVGRLHLEALASDVPGLDLVWNGASAGFPITLYRVPTAPPRFYTVGSAVTAPDDAEALRLLTDPAFDPATTVVLPAGAHTGEGGGEPGSVTVVEERPQRLRLRVERATLGWLVAFQTWFPGWQARVNGQPAEALRANVAFTAVPVGAGVSEVELVYDPVSVRLGLLVSAGALALTALLALLFVRSSRRATVD